MPTCCAAMTGPARAIPRILPRRSSRRASPTPTSGARPPAATRSRFRATCRCTCTCRSASRRVSTAAAIASSRATCGAARRMPSGWFAKRKWSRRCSTAIATSCSCISAAARRISSSRPALAGLVDSLGSFFHFSTAANAGLFHRARSAQRARRRHRGVRGHGLQSRELRRAGFRSRRAAGDQSRAEHRRNAARHRCLPRRGLPFRQRGSHLWPAAPDARRFPPHAEHHRARAARSRRGLRLRAHAAEVQGAAADR